MSTDSWGGQVISTEKRSERIEELLEHLRDGREGAFDELVPFVMVEMRTLARRTRSKFTLYSEMPTTGLVQDAYLKLRRARDLRDENHLYALIATAVRQIILDRLDKLRRSKEHVKSIPLDDLIATLDAHVRKEHAADLTDLSRALDGLAEVNPIDARIVELRFFGGRSMPEIAEILAIPLRTVERRWRYARTWLARFLK